MILPVNYSLLHILAWGSVAWGFIAQLFMVTIDNDGHAVASSRIALTCLFCLFYGSCRPHLVQELVISNLVRVNTVISQSISKQDEDRTTEFL